MLWPLSAAYSASEEELKSVLIYNIIRFTTWPDSAFTTPDAAFNVCFVGRNSLSAALATLNAKSVQGHDLVIVEIEDEKSLRNCQALYIAPEQSIRFAGLARALAVLPATRPVLTLSDSKNFIQRGGMVEISVEQDRLKFTVVWPRVRDAGLAMRANLLKLADVVDEPHE